MYVLDCLHTEDANTEHTYFEGMLQCGGNDVIAVSDPSIGYQYIYS